MHYDALLFFLRAGAFGEVSLVHCNKSGNCYAMKRMEKDYLSRKNHCQRILAERDLLMNFDNPWIVKLYHAFQDDSKLYMIMEYLSGGDLMTHLLRVDVFPEETVRFYMAELVEAVQSIHKLGYIHRDIKPDNICLTAAGHLKLLDFGLCRFSEEIKALSNNRNNYLKFSKFSNLNHPSKFFLKFGWMV
jgi:protein-serine/threonine kinase